MKVEIERKFLVRPALLPPTIGQKGHRYTQGYLSPLPSVRVRLEHDVKAWLTIKGSATSESPGHTPALSRNEFEYEIPTSDAIALLVMCRSKLDKIRHVTVHEGHTWEVDEFLGPHRGLWLAEIELESENEKFERPTWLTDEVSEDPRYSNGALARAGRAPGASWPAIARALELLGNHLKNLDSGKRLAAIGPLMESASLIAVADGVVDDDERGAIRKVLQRLSVDALSDVVADAMLASSVDLIEAEGVDRRCDTVSDALVRHDVAREGVFIAVLVAEVSTGISESERRVLDRMVQRTGMDGRTYAEAMTSIREALGH